MRRDLLLLPSAALAGTLLLTACGMQWAGTTTPGAAPASSGTSSCPSPLPQGGSTAPSPDPSADGTGNSETTDGVRLLDAAGCPVFEITNTGAATATFTITYEVLSDAGGALSTARETVPSLRPGTTVRRAADLGAPDESLGDAAGGARVRIITVRSVPTAEAPSTGGACPASGVHLYADDGDAAMGLRVVGLHLTNCGTHPYTLDGYPHLELFDDEHRAVGGVKILHGGDAVASGTGADGPPRPLVLKPGEGARAELVWRNTTLQGSDPVNAPYVRVVPKPGAPAVMVTPELDLGTTGRLAVGPWKSDAGSAG